MYVSGCVQVEWTANVSVSLHVQALLGFGSLILGAVADHSVTVRQVEVECDQRAVLHAQRLQGRAINLGNMKTYDERVCRHLNTS